MNNLIEYIKLLDKKHKKTYKLIDIQDEIIFINVGSKTSRFYKDLTTELDHLNIWYHIETVQKYDYIIHFYR